MFVCASGVMRGTKPKECLHSYDVKNANKRILFFSTKLLYFILSHQISGNGGKEERFCTLRKASEMGPSLSDATSSCFTFSNPFVIACISSAKDFNCICMRSKTPCQTSFLYIMFEFNTKKYGDLRCGFQATKVQMKIKKRR